MGNSYKIYGSFIQNLQKKYNIHLTNMPLNGTITHDRAETWLSFREQQIIVEQEDRNKS